ncbi:TRAP transporter small permease [Geochorda subterranea]|uniref:TRAP transporter small permease n=1 Tax=Geochorda subterranea TaxID=3109564 RepID=A0ABZ1BSW4_9FIRM|nr:TRAP transporter small permease [Limnochorda sp. LNt]WRP15648.1 TRAP transporter small permease [Limnochorda sp. LNt]
MTPVLRLLRCVVEWLVMGLTGMLVVTVSANVFARYLFLSGLVWAEELARIGFVWVVFLGAYVALTRGNHLAIRLVTDRVPARHRRAVRTVSGLLMLAFLGTVAWYGSVLVARTVAFGRVTPILGISAAWGYAAVPVSSALMFVHVLHLLLSGSETDQGQ